jgi:hypothetical protein
MVIYAANTSKAGAISIMELLAAAESEEASRQTCAFARRRDGE